MSKNGKITKLAGCGRGKEQVGVPQIGPKGVASWTHKNVDSMTPQIEKGSDNIIFPETLALRSLIPLDSITCHRCL